MAHHLGALSTRQLLIYIVSSGCFQISATFDATGISARCTVISASMVGHWTVGGGVTEQDEDDMELLVPGVWWSQYGPQVPPNKTGTKGTALFSAGIELNFFTVSCMVIWTHTHPIEWIPHFALLVCTVFTLPINLSLSQPRMFCTSTLLILPAIPLAGSEQLGQNWYRKVFHASSHKK